MKNTSKVVCMHIMVFGDKYSLLYCKFPRA